MNLKRSDTWFVDSNGNYGGQSVIGHDHNDVRLRTDVDCKRRQMHIRNASQLMKPA